MKDRLVVKSQTSVCCLLSFREIRTPCSWFVGLRLKDISRKVRPFRYKYQVSHIDSL